MYKRSMMEIPIQHGDEEWRLLVEIIDACHSTDTDMCFHNITYPKIRKLLPHEYFMYGHIDLHSGNLLSGKNLNFPQNYLDHVLACTGDNDFPLARKWSQQRKPAFYEPTKFSHSPVTYNKKQSTTARITSGVIVHGVADGSGTTATCYAFGGICDVSNPQIETIVRWVTPHIHAALIPPIKKPSSGMSGTPLSSRERNVLRRVAQGKTDAEIAAELFVSVCTIRTHMRNISQKLGAANRTHAVTQALYRGLVGD